MAVPRGFHPARLSPRRVRAASRIDHADASVDSAFGEASIGWRLVDQRLEVVCELPFGTTGEFRAPVGDRSTVSVGGSLAPTPVSLGPGRHRVVVTHPVVAGRASAPPVAAIER